MTKMVARLPCQRSAKAPSFASFSTLSRRLRTFRATLPAARRPQTRGASPPFGARAMRGSQSPGTATTILAGHSPLFPRRDHLPRDIEEFSKYFARMHSASPHCGASLSRPLPELTACTAAPLPSTAPESTSTARALVNCVELSRPTTMRFATAASLYLTPRAGRGPVS